MTDVRTYQVKNSTITLRFGDITESEADVLVSSDDFMLTRGGGVSRAISHAAGQPLAAHGRKLVPSELGDVLVTTAGGLGAKYIFHAVTIGDERGRLPPEAIVRQATQRALDLLPLLGCRSIAFPAIGAGEARIDYSVVASEMATTLVRVLLDSAYSFDVSLYLMDETLSLSPEELFQFFEGYVVRTLGINAPAQQDNATLEPPRIHVPGPNSEGDEDTRRRMQVYNMLRSLDERRNRAELEFLETLKSDAPDSLEVLTRLHEELTRPQEFRRTYEAEAKPLVQRASIGSVFLSSTAVDLQPHRQAIRKVVEELGLRFIGMEEFAASAQVPAAFIQQRVEEADLFVGVLGLRYGSVDPATGCSMTELEYRQAVKSSKDLAMFVMDDERAEITAGMVEKNPGKFAKLMDLRSVVLRDHVCSIFTNVDDLTAKAQRTLADRRNKVSAV